MQVQLIWEDPIANEKQEIICPIPVALGRFPEEILNENEKKQFFQIKLSSHNISRLHALITYVNGQIILEDRSANGTIVNGRKVLKSSVFLSTGDTVQIGPFNINITLILNQPHHPKHFNSIDFSTIQPQKVQPESRLLFDPKTDLLYPGYAEHAKELPLPQFFNDQEVSLEKLKRRFPNLSYKERDFISIGGGIGSFVFVDTLRIAGVKTEQILVLGRGECAPYSRYRSICRNSQIPDHERLRSGSDSCPDNIWGFPGYAIREAWQELHKGRIDKCCQYLWQVFSEPFLSDTYTPRSGYVFQAIKREAQRIGWENIWRGAHVRAIRKTDDGRYIIAYSDPKTPSGDYKYAIAKYVYLATGYTSVRFLDDLQEYRRQTGDTQAVVNAYENHEPVYQKLIQQGGLVIVRGEGIVASRIMQKLYEIRASNKKIKIIHLVRSEKTESNQFERARRYRENGWEFQPYNWPKGTWGGDLRSRLENASPSERVQLLRDWGGTTTANRRDWRHIIRQGMEQNWYQRVVGVVKLVKQDQDKRITIVINRSMTEGEETLKADFIIDATGLVAKPLDDPLLGDLVRFYGLPLNLLKGLEVSKNFELEKMRHGKGRMYAAGIMTLGSSYAPVDTFLGLQYVAQRAIENMAKAKAENVHYIEGFYSISQWYKWATNQSP